MYWYVEQINNFCVCGGGVHDKPKECMHTNVGG